MPKKIKLPQDTPILKVIEDIKNGVIHPHHIDKDMRKEIIFILQNEGQSYPQIGKFLKRASKTIGRDARQIEDDNKIEPSLDLVQRNMGDLKRKFTSHWSSLTRIARNSNSSTSEKLAAEKEAWGVIIGFFTELRKTGYHPSTSQVEININNNAESGDDSPWEDLQVEMDRIKRVAQRKKDVSLELQEQIKHVENSLEKGKAVEAIIKIKEDLTHKKGQSDGKESGKSKKRSE